MPHARHLAHVEVEEVPQHDRLTLAPGKRRQRAADVDRVGVGGSRGGLHQLRPRAPFHEQRAEPAATEVQRDRDHPRLERLDVVGSVRALHGSHEGFLHRILRRRQAAGHERHGADDASVSVTQELLEIRVAQHPVIVILIARTREDPSRLLVVSERPVDPTGAWRRLEG